MCQALRNHSFIQICSTKCSLACDSPRIGTEDYALSSFRLVTTGYRYEQCSNVASPNTIRWTMEMGLEWGTGPWPRPVLLGRTSEENSVGESARTAEVTILVRHDQNIFQEKHASSFDCRIAGLASLITKWNPHICQDSCKSCVISSNFMN